MSQPVVEGSLGSPPFEKPNIEQVNKKLEASSDHTKPFMLGCRISKPHDIHVISSFLVSKGVLNFVQYKFSHLAPKERQTMFELSKMFLLCLNYWKLETPSQYRQRTQKDDGTAYKVDYTRCVL